MEKYTRPEGIETSDSDEDDFYDENEVPDLPNKIQQLSRPRHSVSAEVYGFHNPKPKFVAKKIPKNESQREMLKGLLKKIFMFKVLERENLEIVIDAMEERRFSENDDVICQGDDGDELYVVYQGTLDCFKVFAGRRAGPMGPCSFKF